MSTYASGLILALLFVTTGCVKTNCPLPKALEESVKKVTINSINTSPDIKRNSWSMNGLCADRITFKEGRHTWTFLLVWNSKHPTGPFWYLPHDNEESAFDAAVYAVKRYGGGFLAVESNGQRYHKGIDPNRNFKTNSLYSETIFKIIDTFKLTHLPYLALHTNADGHSQNGGKGTVSMKKRSQHISNFSTHTIKTGHHLGLADEDSLVYLSGKTIDKKIVQTFTSKGLNVKFEKVSRHNNDHSMSNYIVLEKKDAPYLNIETEHGDVSTHKKMVDRVMKILRVKTL